MSESDLPSWEDALLRLNAAGWETDDIESACEALIEACESGEASDYEVTELGKDDVEEILDVDVDPQLVPSLLSVAEQMSRADADTRDFREALYDLDAFAYDSDDD